MWKIITQFITTKLTGRKFLAFLTGTVALFTGFLSQENWLILAGIYVGAEALIDGVGKMKGLPPPTIEEGVVEKK